MTTEHHLHAATLRRANDTRARARDTIRRLNQQGAAINYVTVAEAAGVSRSLLYRDPELRAEIERLRNPALTTKPRPPAAERMSQASRDELNAALRHEVKELRRENQALRTRLATTLGEQRSQIPSVQHLTPINDMSPTT